MAQKLYNDTAVQDIADAIREKNGEPATTKYKIAEMGDAIRAIPSGGEKIEVKDASYMFYNGARLENKDDFKFTTSYVKSMFQNCNTAPEEDILSILENTDNTFINVTDTSYMFYYCKNLKDININFSSNPNSLKNLNNMFSGCSNLENVSFGNLFTAPKAENVSFMFNDCPKIQNFDFSIFTPSAPNNTKLFNLQRMFQNCTNLKSVIIPEDVSFFTNAKTTFNTSYMFSGCSNLERFVYKKDFPLKDSSAFMFQNCTNLEYVEIANPWQNGSETQNCSWNNMFDGCSNLKTIKIATGNRTQILYRKFTSSNIFRNCTSLETVIIDLGATNVFKLSNAEALTGVPTTCKFYVTDSAVNTYKTSTNWSSRASQIYPLSEYVEP